MMYSIALESLLQRGKSAFFSDLVALYQKSQDALYEPYNAPPFKVFNTLKHIGFDVDLSEIVKKHLNLELSQVDVEESIYPNMYCGIKKTSDAERQIKKKTETPGTLIEKINHYYEDRKGIFHQESDTVFPYRFGLGVMTGLWSVRNDDKSFYFTPEELAAATLHEVGHIDYFVRESHRIYTRMIDAADILDYVSRTPDKSVLMALIKAIKSSPNLDKSWKKIVEDTEKYFSTTNSFDDPSYLEALSTLCLAVSADAATANVNDFNSLIEYSHIVKHHTNTLIADEERTADEFASRQGAYQAFVSMLTKLEKLSTTKSKLVFNQEVWNAVALTIGLFQSFKSLFDLSLEDVNAGYDPIIRRLELIVETAKHAFHDPALSSSEKADIQIQIVEAENYIKDYQSTTHRQIRSALKSWKDTVIRLGRIVTAPVQTRMTRDYSALQEANRSLGRHPLYYLANKQ